MPKKPKPKPKPTPKPKPHPLIHEKLLRELLHEFETEAAYHAQRTQHTDLLVHSIIQRLEHLTELVVALGEPHGNPEMIAAILAKVNESKAKLSAALDEAEPPASPESGDPPQG